MTENDERARAARWNKRYRREGETWLGREPRTLLQQWIDRLPTAGLALDAGAGVGVQATYLAARGWRVVACDIAERGLALARDRARERDLAVWPVVVDLDALWLPAARFDLILNFYVLERRALPVYRRALKPGGWLIFETFLRDVGDASAPDYFLRPGELEMAFAGWEVLHTETQRSLHSRSGEMRRSRQFVARKPGKSDAPPDAAETAG